MAILFAGGEAESFNVIGTTALYSSTDASHHDSTFTRGAIGITGTTTCDVDLTSGETELWVHFGWAYNMRQSFWSAAEADPILRLIDMATGREVVRVRMDTSPSDYSLGFEYWDGSAYQFVPGGSIMASDTFYELDLHCKIADSGGVFRLYVDGTQIAEFVGDTLNSGYTSIDRVRFGSNIGSRSSTDWGSLISQVVVADQDTRGMKVATLKVTGNGNSTGWDNDYQNVDEALVYSDSDVIISDAAGEVETYELGNHGLSDYVVLALAVNARGLRGASGPQNIQLAVRIGGTDYFSGNTGPGTTFGPLRNMWPLNPDTSAAWTLSELDSLEAGVKSVA